jgi:hypothetical protein
MLFSPQKKEVKKSSPVKTLVNLATIASATITCFRLFLMGIFSIKTVVIVILAIVIFLALGNNAAKIILACAALILFVLLYSGGTREGFNALMGSMLTLICVLAGVYIMLRGLFRGGK